MINACARFRSVVLNGMSNQQAKNFYNANISTTQRLLLLSLFKPSNLSPTYGSRYSKIDQVKIFKGCLPQILLRAFLNTLADMAREIMF